MIGPDGYAEVSAMDFRTLSDFSRKLNALISELELMNKQQEEVYQKSRVQ